MRFILYLMPVCRRKAMLASFMAWTALLSLLTAPPVMAEGLDDIAASGTLRFGYHEQLPFASLQRNLTVDGYAIELCQKLALAVRSTVRRPQLKVEIVAVAPKDVAQMLGSKAIDVACNGHGASFAKHQQLALGLPVYFATSTLLVPQASPVEGLSDLFHNKVVAVVDGSEQDILLTELKKQGRGPFSVQRVSDPLIGFESLGKGTAHAFFTHDFTVQALLGRPSRVPVPREVKRSVMIDAMGLAFRANDTKLREIANRTLRQMMASGELAQLYKKWFLGPLPTHPEGLGLAMSPLLKAQIRSPDDFVVTQLLRD
jgi:ABC-type amino acid transport substrate-binding protein